MSIKVHNTLSGKKEALQPIEPGHIKLYVCGITSYDYCHIGHARSALAFDMIVRYMRYRNLKVTYIRNFTDIDDKIINRANEQGTSSEKLAQRFIDEFYTDMDKLGVDRPSMEPKATDHIEEMVDLISDLIEKGMAYQSGNDVYFSVEKFDDYGKLSRRNLDDLRAGARISINDAKKNPMDFVLWKGSKPGEPKWESPWGEGRPGWHIECSAMSRKYLGETFDIHGGGKDLVFPHHENELAQSEGANGQKFVNTWIHHGFVTIKDVKMSKSLGNFLTIRDILKHYHPEVLRFFIYSTQYRNPLDFSESAMKDATVGLDRLYECVANIESLNTSSADPDVISIITQKDSDKLNSLEQRFQDAMDNDFNTAQAQGILFDTAKILNKVKKQLPSPPSKSDVDTLVSTISLMKALASIMGILTENASTYLANKKEALLADLTINEDQINSYIAERISAKQNKDWARCDEIRDLLIEQKIELKDGADGTTWTVKR